MSPPGLLRSQVTRKVGTAPKAYRIAGEPANGNRFQKEKLNELDWAFGVVVTEYYSAKTEPDPQTAGIGMLNHHRRYG